MNAHFHTKFFTQVATNTYSVSGVFIHALYEPHQSLINTELAKSPPDDKSGYMIKCLFQIDKGHVQCLTDVIKLFLQLVYNEYGACGATSRYEANLRSVQD